MRDAVLITQVSPNWVHDVGQPYQDC